MSNSQRMRRITSVSPASGKSQGPMRATLPFNLMSSTSGTISYNYTEGSRVKSQRSPEFKGSLSPERTRTTSPCSAKGQSDKWRPVTSSKVTGVPLIRRTSSLDAIYLAGQWPRDSPHTYCGRLLLEKCTQTPNNWEDVPDRRKALPPRSHSAGTGDQLEKIIRHRLPRPSKDTRQRYSPVLVPTSTTSRAISIPVLPAANLTIPKRNLTRMRSSVEGFNQEIEKHFLGTEEELQRLNHPTPDGHRAPIADMFRNNTRHANTQTPLGGVTVTASGTDSGASSGNTSGSNSPPGHVPVPVSLEEEDVGDVGPPRSRPETDEPKFRLGDSQEASPEMEGESSLGTSPRINKFLAREPPDGCDRVKIVEDTRDLPVESASYRVLKPSVNFILKPSSSSAFYPLCKPYVRQQSPTALPVTGVDAK